MNQPTPPDRFEGKGLMDIEAMQKAQLLLDIQQAALQRPLGSPDFVLMGSREYIETINNFLKT